MNMSLLKQNFTLRSAPISSALGFLWLPPLTVLLLGLVLTGCKTQKIEAVSQDGSKVLVDVAKLRSLQLKDLQADANTAIRYSAKYNLIILFSISDCSKCLEEVGVWNRLASGHDKAQLSVSGIVVKSSLNETRSFVEALSPSFPLFLDDQDQVESKVGLPSTTPFKILLNNRGEVVLAEFTSNDVKRQKLFEEKMKSIIEKDSIARM